MIDESDDVTTWRFHRMSVLAVVGSALLHATALAVLLPEMLPREERLSEQAVELTLERPAPFEAPAMPAAEPAARRLPSGPSGYAFAAPAPSSSEAASVPMPAEPHINRTVPSAEPPPTLTERDFGNSATPPGPLPALETMLSAVDGPPMVTGRDFARIAPSILAKSSILQDRPQAPPPQQVVRQGAPKRASQQNDAIQSGAYGAASPVTRDATSYSSHQAQQDYLLQVVRKLSQARFYSPTREERQGGLVVARLTIDRDGRLVDVTLAKPTGSPGLDRGVMDTIRKASPFAPLPAELAAESHTFIVPINFTQER